VGQFLETNHEFTILASAARTATTDSDIFKQQNFRGLALYLDVTAVTTSAAQIATINLQVPIPHGSTVYKTLYSFAIASTSAASQTAYLIYPEAATSASWNLPPAQGPLPQRFLIDVAHTSSASSITYSIGGCYLL
jgi:hypothetical protein